jgi:hypothetical protein
MRRRSEPPPTYGRQDVRVIELRGDPYLTQEAVRPDGRGYFRTQHFDRDLPLVLEVAGEINGGHSAATELALDRVAVRKG